jgi:microcystin-dependent protein
MKRILGNYLSQENNDFPVDAETFQYIQDNVSMLSILGNLAGDKAILLGCEPEQNGTRRKAGYLFVRTKDFPDGEVLYWEGGSISGGMHIQKEVISVSAEDDTTEQTIEYTGAYTIRYLAAGFGEENYKWTDMHTVASLQQMAADIEAKNKTLENKIALLTPPPVGVVQIWAGKNIPSGYVLCDGQQYKSTEYAELYKVIGTAYNNAVDYNGVRFSTSTGYFRVPDLRGRFIVGYDTADSDYNSYGKAGGEKKHALTTTEMPSHNHVENLWKQGSNTWREGGKNSGAHAVSWHDQTTPFGVTAYTGGGQKHENRPPFYTLAYIMRVK